MRLISADRIKVELCESNMPKKYRDFCWRVIKDENLSPTVDAVPVVRCKDCKYGDWDNEEADAIVLGACLRQGQYGWMCGNDFCSYGKRKDEVIE